MRQNTRLAKLEAITPAQLAVSWVVLRADGTAFLRMADGTRLEADPDHLPPVKAYSEEVDPDSAWNSRIARRLEEIIVTNDDQAARAFCEVIYGNQA